MYIYPSHFYDKYVCNDLLSVNKISVCLSVCLSAMFSKASVFALKVGAITLIIIFIGDHQFCNIPSALFTDNENNRIVDYAMVLTLKSR